MEFHWEKTISGAKKTWERFPFVMLCATMAYISSVLLVELLLLESSKNEALLTNYGYVIYLSLLGIGLLFSTTLWVERQSFDKSKKIIINASLIVFLIVLFFLFPSKINMILAFQLGLWALSIHLLAAFLPFYSKGENFGFWAYNQLILGRFLMSAVFSGVLFVGISLALVAINVLFSANISPKTFSHIFITCTYLHTWFFLAGAPDDLKILDEKIDYPEFLGVLTKYVLLPLTSLYMLILYAYAFRILLNMELPKGWVVYLILAFSIAGIFALLMIYPLQNEKNEGWINIFIRTFYIALLPLLVLLFISIGVRISQYGFTENRYYVLMLGLWLLGMCVHYAVFRRYEHIKIIPLSLFLIFFLSSFGPWSSFSVAEYSQTSRLFSLLEKNKCINSSRKIINNKIDIKDHEEIINIIDFFTRRDKINIINSRLETPFKFSKKDSDYERESKITSHLGLKISYRNRNEVVKPEDEHRSIIQPNTKKQIIELKNYDYMYEVDWNVNDEDSKKIIDNRKSISFNAEKEVVFISDRKTYTFNITKNLEKMVEIEQYKSIEEVDKVISLEKDNLKAQIIIRNLDIMLEVKTKKIKKINTFNFQFFWKEE